MVWRVGSIKGVLQVVIKSSSGLDRLNLSKIAASEDEVEDLSEGK